MAQAIDIKQHAKIKAAVLADQVFELQHNISHGAVPNMAQLKSLDDMSAQLSSLTRFHKNGVPDQRCAHCHVELSNTNRAQGFGALCKPCEVLSR